MSRTARILRLVEAEEKCVAAIREWYVEGDDRPPAPPASVLAQVTRFRRIQLLLAKYPLRGGEGAA